MGRGAQAQVGRVGQGRRCGDTVGRTPERAVELVALISILDHTQPISADMTEDAGQTP